MIFNVSQGGKYTISAIVDDIFPVGIIVPFANTVEPAAIWGGTWELLAEGQTIIQSGGNHPLGSTGGAETHVLTKEEMPRHVHEQTMVNADSNYRLTFRSGGSITTKVAPLSEEDGSSGTYDLWSSVAGGSKPHNNMPPYVAVNLWKRTA